MTTARREERERIAMALYDACPMLARFDNPAVWLTLADAVLPLLPTAPEGDVAAAVDQILVSLTWTPPECEAREKGYTALKTVSEAIEGKDSAISALRAIQKGILKANEIAEQRAEAAERTAATLRDEQQVLWGEWEARRNHLVRSLDVSEADGRHLVQRLSTAEAEVTALEAALTDSLATLEAVAQLARAQGVRVGPLAAAGYPQAVERGRALLAAPDGLAWQVRHHEGHDVERIAVAIFDEVQRQQNDSTAWDHPAVGEATRGAYRGEARAAMAAMGHVCTPACRLALGSEG